MMNKKIYRFIGREGRTTVPYEFRVKLGYKQGDLISYELQDNGKIIVTHEKVCDCGNKNRLKGNTREHAFAEFINSLSPDQRKSFNELTSFNRTPLKETGRPGKGM